MTPEELQDWLEARPEETRQQEAVWIAHRCAMRVLVRWWDTADRYDLESVFVLRGSLLADCIAVGSRIDPQGLVSRMSIRLDSFADQAERDLFSRAQQKGANGTDAKAFARFHGYSVLATRAVLDAILSKSDHPAVMFATLNAIDLSKSAAGDGASAELRDALQRDADYLSANLKIGLLPLWVDGTNLDWSYLVDRSQNRDDGPWNFWIDWYQRALDGAPQPMDLLEEIALQPDEFWQGTDGEVNARIAKIVAEWEAGQTKTLSPLAAATPVEFTFDALARVMRMVGIEDSLSHLKDPEIVQAFLDDAEEVEDLFQDLVDDFSSMSGGNMAGVLQRRAEKILKEFQRTRDKMHLRANLLVIHASELETFSKDPKARGDIGPTLGEMLDRRIEMLKTLCRKHFSASYLALAPLSELKTDFIDQEAVLRLFDNAIERLSALPDEDLVALDAEGEAVLRDMLRELHETRAVIMAAPNEDFRAVLESRFAQSSGAYGLILNRFFTRSWQAAESASDNFEKAQKMGEQVKDLKGILTALAVFLGLGGG